MSKFFQRAVFIWWKQYVCETCYLIQTISLNTKKQQQQQQHHVETQQLPHKLHPLSYQSTSNITPRLLLTTSQLTPQISIPLHYPHFPHTHNKLHICVVQPSPNIRSHSVLSYYGHALVTLYVQFLCRKASIFVSYIIKEFAPAFSCAYIELWMHLGSLESTQEAKGALGWASSN